MRQWKRLFYYLLINVLVSACTVLVVLTAWEQMHEPTPGGVIPMLFNLARPAATATVPVAGPVDTAIPMPTPTQAFVVYQVQSGDTFESIAASYGINVDDLVTANGFAGSQPLGAGEVLRVPVTAGSPASGGVVIDSVIGVGSIDSERVLLKHNGEGELSLIGWQLEDENGNIFIFPQFPELTLFKGGAVNVYTRAGASTVVDLYWGLEKPVWQSGEEVTLRNAQGDVQDTYLVP